MRPYRWAGTVTGLSGLVVGLLLGSQAALWWLYGVLLNLESLHVVTDPVLLCVTWPWWVAPWRIPDPALLGAGLGALVLAAVVAGLLTRLLLARAAAPTPRRAFWTGWLATVLGGAAGGQLQWAVSTLLADSALLLRTGVEAAGYAVLWGVLAGLLAGVGTMLVVRRANARQ